MDELANLLPPIAVSQFRWWACKSCLHNVNKIESGGENGSVTNFHDLESRRLKTDVESFKGNAVADPHPRVSTSLSGFRVVSGDRTLGEGSIEAASFINSKDGHFQPLLLREDKGKDSIITNSTKKGKLNFLFNYFTLFYNHYNAVLLFCQIFISSKGNHVR